MINNCLTFPMIFVVFYHFISNMLSCFNIIAEYNEAEGKFWLVFFIEGIFVIANYLVLLICIHSCYCLSNEAEKALNIVSGLVDTKMCTAGTKKMLKSFLTQSQFRKFKLETCFFTLDWKLILAVSFFKTFNFFLVNRTCFR